MKYQLTLLIVIVLASCSGSDQKEAVPKQPTSTDSTIIEDIVEEPVVIDSNTLKLMTLLDSPLNFSRVKQEFHMLEMGTILQKKYMHPMDSTLHNYNYGAVGALLNYGQGRRDFEPNLDSLMDQGRLVSFSTYKPWSTAQDKYYSADNELLVGIECMVRHPAMEPSNFVGTDVKDIQAQYGREWASRNNCLVYFENQKVLVLHRAGSTIDWFKYYWLNDGISQIDEMPEELFSWKKR